MSSRADRDRDEQGRPKNARPRDAFGRPLARGARAEFEEAAAPATPDEALRAGVAHFNAQRFFQAHEVWEEAWHPAPEPERDFWQGLVQVAVGFTHFQRGNARGAVTLLRRGARRLTSYGETHNGVEIGPLARAAVEAADQIERDGASAVPTLPTLR